MAIRSLLAKIVTSVVAVLLLVAVMGNTLTWLLGIPADDPRNIGLVVRLGAAILIVLVLCVFLTRHITLPIAHVGSASHQIATGDLGTRIGPALGDRNDELGKLGQDFDRMAAQIEALVASERRLIRDVSHELRSPLARLSISVGLARRDASATTAAHLDRIEHEVERLNQLIGQLLAMARLDVGVQPSQRTVFDLSTVVDEVAADADFEARAGNRGVRVLTSECCLISGVPDLIRSAVENVVRNGIRHTPGGSHVDITLRRHGGRPDDLAELCVRDYGAGVAEDSLPRLFEPFYRGAAPAPGTGAGLGLAITRRAIQLHDGSIMAANAVNGGLAITISIPLATMRQDSIGV